MVEKVLSVMNRDYKVSTKELIAIVMLVLTLVGCYNSVLKMADNKYATKEFGNMLEKKIDKVDSKIDKLLGYFAIKGMEKK